MAVNVDTVYQTVQALANKEQRGYITPQEFNLFANQVQQDIFEQYFYNLNAFAQQRPEAHEFGNSVPYIKMKLESISGATYSKNDTVTSGVTLPSGKRLGRIFYNDTTGRRMITKVNPEDIYNYIPSTWHNCDDAYYFDDGYRKIQVWQNGQKVTSGVTCESVSGKPKLVYWNYIVVNEKPVYDPTTSANFDLHESEQTDLVISILKLAGISIEDPFLLQAAGQAENQNLQQENK